MGFYGEIAGWEPWTRGYKKDDEPNALFDRGYEPLHKREGAHVYTKEGIKEPSR